MGRRKKGSNKMGDKTFNKWKSAVSDEEGGQVGSDGVYDEVDNWELEQDKMLLESVGGGGRKKSQSAQQEVFALSGTDSDSDLELPNIKQMKKDKKKKKKAEKKEELDDDDLLGDLLEEGQQGNEPQARAWGKKKKAFYGGNTGYSRPREAGDDASDFDEDEAEEREAALLQERQLERMEEDDFFDAFSAPQKSTKEKVVEEAVKRDLSKLSEKELLAMFKQQSPEFEGIVLDFKDKMADAVDLSRILSLHDQGKLPPSPMIDYIGCRLKLVLSYCTNIMSYLMFKSKSTNLKLHPVTSRLVQYKQLIDSLDDLDSQVRPQMESLLERLDNGEEIETVVREEKRREKKALKKLTAQPKRLKVLSKKPVDKENVPEIKETKRKHESLEDLTRDERLALEVYKAMKKRKKGDEEEDNDEEEEKDDDGASSDDGLVAPTEGSDAEMTEEQGKRGITYQIAKNKGLAPKRGKLQRNPRVKNRMKFEKAKKRRKGAVREVRTETTRYSGEMFGINARVRKGVKLK